MSSKIFISKNVVPEVYDKVLQDAFGSEWRTWLPETTWVEIKRHFGVDPSYEVRTKINAIRIYLTTDKFFTDAPVFENIVLAVNDMFVDPATMQLASPEEIIYALRCLKPLRPAPALSKEVIGYVDVACRNVGLLRYPDELAFAQPDYTGELAAAVKKIHPRDIDPTKMNPKNMIEVQSYKLYQIHMYVVQKFSLMDIKALEPSTI